MRYFSVCTRLGTVASFPKGSRAFVFEIDVLGVAAADDLHGVGYRVHFIGCGQDMDMIGHQAVGVHSGAVAPGCLLP